MSRFSWTLGLAGTLLLGSGSFYKAVAVPEDRWDVLETPHFSIHRHPSDADSAERIGRAAEEVLPKILSDFGITLKQSVPVVLSRSVPFNGNAEPLKDRITLDPLLAKSSVIGTKRFIAHELTHVITFEALAGNTQGFEGLGKLSKLSSLAGLPVWFLEGLAQYEAEYWSTGNDRMLRLRTLEGKLLSDGERNHFSLLGLYGGAAGYNEGYSLTRYLFDTYGKDRLAKLFSSLRADASLSFPIAIEKVTGHSLATIEADWRKSLAARYEKLAKEVPALPEGAKRLIRSSEEEVNVSPRLSPDGRKIAFLSSRNQESFLYLRGQVMGGLTLVLADRDGGNPKAVALSSGRIDSFDWSPDGKKLILLATCRDKEGKPGYRLLSYDLEKKSSETLVEAPVLASPAWRPKSDEIAYVGEKGGRAALFVLDTRTLKKTELPVDAGERRFADLAWSPDGNRIAASAFRPGEGGKLVLIDPASGQVEPLTSGGATLCDASPAWSPDGRSILFSSNRDGLGDLYRLGINSGEVERITRCYSSPETPSFAEGKILFAAHRALGSEIFVLDRIQPDRKEKRRKPVEQKPDAVLSSLPSLGLIHPYEAKLTNDLLIPQFSSDERGQQLGMSTFYSDILEKHQLGLDLRFGLASGRFSYTASYLNRMGNDPWSIALYDRPELALSGKIDPARFYDNLYLGRRQGFNYALSHDLPGGKNLTLGGDVGFLSVLTPSQGTGGVARTGREHTLTLGWSDTQIRPSGDLDVNPREGYRLGASYALSDHRIGSDFNFSQYQLAGDRFYPLGGKQSLGLHFKAGAQFGDALPLFLGGAQGAAPLFPLRGYPAGSFTGDRLALLGLDYTLPLSSNLDRQLGAFYLNKAFLTAFLESGDAWKAGDPFASHSSVGLELRLKTAFMGQQVVVFRLGVAQQLADDRATRFYLLF